MRKVLAACVWLSLVMNTKMSYAECKIIEHESSTEVVCVGEPPTDSQIKEKENSRRNSEQSSNKQQLEQERNQREQAKNQEKNDLERCSLDHAICVSNTKDIMRCMGEKARCEKNIYAGSPVQNKKTCQNICSSDHTICVSNTKNIMRCMGEKANCEKSCLY